MTTPVLDWSLTEAARIAGGAAVGPEASITSVVTDSRLVSGGSLFVALAGAAEDGHAYAAAALAAGAAAVLVEPGRVTVEPRIEVADTLEGLRRLAVRRRAELSVPVAAITGSTGKTSTKDLLAAALGPGTHASPKSYNNEVGVPLTVLSAPPGLTHLVLEAGSRGKGHIDWLAPAIRPDVAVITNVGLVHLETFGTPEGVVDAKWELVAALTDAGVAVLPAGDERLHRPHPGDTLTFGGEDGADVRIGPVTLDARARPGFELSHGSERVAVSLQMAGAHQAANAAAAAAAAVALGVPLAEAAERMAGAVGSPWRMEIHAGRFTVVNDAYNANPDSVESALRSVAEMGGRHHAVLGLMAELGSVTEEEHRRIGRLAGDLGFELVVVGEDHGIAAGAGRAAVSVATSAEAERLVLRRVRPGDVVLVKASRVAGLEDLAGRLVDAAEEPAP